MTCRFLAEDCSADVPKPGEGFGFGFLASTRFLSSALLPFLSSGPLVKTE